MLPGTLSVLLIVVGLVVLFPATVHFVPPGHAGVRWKRFLGGTELENDHREGVVFTAPWDTFTIYDVRIQLSQVQLDVLMQDGLPLGVTLSIRYHLNRTGLGYLQRYVGRDYFEKLVEPHTAAEARNLLALYGADNVYSANRKRLQTVLEELVSAAIRKDLQNVQAPKEDVVKIDEILLLSIKLPDSIATAIETKSAERQKVERLEYSIQAEDQERRRKIVEANGIRSYQEIIKSSLTNEFLKWKGIEATVALAQSPSAKTIIMGASGGSLPFVLGLGDDVAQGGKTVPMKPASPSGLSR